MHTKHRRSLSQGVATMDVVPDSGDAVATDCSGGGGGGLERCLLLGDNGGDSLSEMTCNELF